MKLYYPITIDLYKIWPLPVMSAQQNNVGRGAVITLIANGAVIEPDGETVSFYVRRPDGYISYLPARVDGTKIYCDFTNQMLLKPGRIQVEIQMIGGTEASPTEITTPIFLVDVQPSNIDESAIEGQNEFTALQQALAQTAGAVEGANESAQKATAAASAAESAATSASSAATAASSAAAAAGTAGTAASEAATAASSAATAATNAAAAANAAAAQIPNLKPIATSGEASDVGITPIAGMAATDVQAALAEQYSKLQLAPYPISVLPNIPLTCRRIGNKIIINVGGGWIPINKSMLIGYIGGITSILMDSNSIRVIAGNGDLLSPGYVDIDPYTTNITLRLPNDWVDGTYGHIRGSFSFYTLG